MKLFICDKYFLVIHHEEISNFEAVDSVKYLGINLGGKGKNIFRTEKKRVVKKGAKTSKPTQISGQEKQ